MSSLVSAPCAGSTLASPLAELYAAGLLNAGFDWTLVKPHQLDNVRRFSDPPPEFANKALVADDPGLGKTLSAAVISSLCHARIVTDARFCGSTGHARTLIVCPKSLMQQWASELFRFLKLEKHQVVTFETNDVFESQLKLGKYFIISYERLVKVHKTYFQKVNEKGIGNQYVLKDNVASGESWNKSFSLFNGTTFSCLIFDEVHVCRNVSTHRHHACVDVAPGAWRLGLSGTPVVNKMKDLFSITKVLRLDYAYDENFFKRMDDARYRPLFSKFMSSVYTRATKDILNLPELKTRVESFEFTEDEHDIVMYWASVMIAEVDDYLKWKTQKAYGVNITTGEGRWVRVLVAFHRLKQACLHPDLPSLTLLANDKAAGAPEAELGEEEEEEKEDVQKVETGALPVVETSAVETISDVPVALAQTYRKSSKFSFIADTVPTLDGGVLIYSTWSTPLKALKHMLETLNPDMKTGLFIGSASGEERNTLKQQFNFGAIKVMLLTYGAGGVGLNLAPRAKTVIHLDAAWTPAAARQASDRAHRMGCDSVVTEMFLSPKESSDSWVYDNIHKAKKKDMEKVSRIAKKLNDVRVDDSAGMTIEAVCKMTDYFESAVRAWRARRGASGALSTEKAKTEQAGAGLSTMRETTPKRTHQHSGSGDAHDDAIDLTGDDEDVSLPSKFQKTTPSQFVEGFPEVIILE